MGVVTGVVLHLEFPLAVVSTVRRYKGYAGGTGGFEALMFVIAMSMRVVGDHGVAELVWLSDIFSFRQKRDLKSSGGMQGVLRKMRARLVIAGERELTDWPAISARLQRLQREVDGEQPGLFEGAGVLP